MVVETVRVVHKNPAKFMFIRRNSVDQNLKLDGSHYVEETTLVLQTELKNANDYVSALRHRTWAQARPHLK